MFVKQPNVVIASEAKQSIAPQNKCGLLRRVAPRNDDNPQLRDLAACFRASFAANIAPSKNRGRRECRALDAPAAACGV
jgi:hypothetical protein